MKIHVVEQNGRKYFLREDGLKVGIDFVNDKAQYHRHYSSIKNEIIARACGYEKGNRTILDLTAGFAVDAVFLARLGFSVVAVERNKEIFSVLDSSWAIDSAELKWNLKFKFAESLSYLQSIDSENRPDVIYYDPMYPSKEKSALPPKNMQLLHSLIGSDEGSADIIEAAQLKAGNRVVVKRPLSAPPIIKPSSSVEGKMVRYDLYWPKAT